MIPFSGSPLNRASEKRTDQNWIESKRRDPSSLVLPMRRLEPFLLGAENADPPIALGLLRTEIADSLAHFGVTETQENIRKYLYCMRVAEWIGEKKYGNPVFYYPKVDRDPFEYAFTVPTNDPKVD